MEAVNAKNKRRSLKLGLCFALLFMLAALLSACADSKLDEGYGQDAKTDAQIERLCVAFAEYDGSAPVENLKAVLSIRQQNVNKTLSGKADSDSLNETTEEPIPLYCDDDKRVMMEQEEAERAALDYEEEPVTQEPEGLQPEEAAEAVENAAEADEIALEEEAIPEEQAEPETADADTEAALEAKIDEDTEVEIASPEDGLMHGDVPSCEATLDEDGILRFYFEIDPAIYPIDVDSLCVFDTSKSDEESFLFEFPLNTAAQNSRAPFELSWKRALDAQARRDAEAASEDELNAKAETVKSGETTLTGTVKITGVSSDKVPQELIVSYFMSKNPVTQVKTLKLANNDFTYDSSSNIVQFTMKETGVNPVIYVLSINDVTNNLTYTNEIGNGDSDPYCFGLYYLDDSPTKTISYLSFVKGFTQSPTVCVNNFPSFDEKTKFSHLYMRAHVLGYSLNPGLAYNERSGDYFWSEANSSQLYHHFNLVCADKYDDIILTRLEGSESYWDGSLSYWYGSNNLLSVDYNSFTKNKAATESDIGIVGKIIINNIDCQPSFGSVTYCRSDDESRTLMTQELKGASYDKATQTLTAFIDFTSPSNDTDSIYIKKVNLDNYICSGTMWIWYAGRTNTIDFSKFTKSGDSGSSAGSRQVHVRVADLPYSPDTFKVAYTAGASSAEKTVNIASYKNGVLTFGSILTNASYITLKQVEVGTSVYKASKRIDLSSNNAHVEILSFDDFVQNNDIVKNYEVVINGVPSYKSGSAKVKYHRGDSYETVTRSSGVSYSSADQKVTIKIPESRSFLTLAKIVVNNHYKNVSSRIRKNCKINYSSMSAESVSYCQSVTGVSSKPNSASLLYSLYNDSSKTYTVSGTYDSSAQTVNFRFKAKEDVKVTSIVINGKLYSKGVSLTYPNPNNTIKYANMFSTRLVVKNVAQAVNYIMVKYKLYNSKTGAYSSTYSKTAGTYSSVNQTYTFPFEKSLLNGTDYDTVIVKSVALNNSVSTTERTVNLGKTYNLLSSGLTAQNTRYSVNVYSGTSGVCGKTGTMKYTINGTTYSANGTVKYDSNKGRYVMHFETVKTKSTSVKITKVTVGNKYYGSSFTLKYGQNKANSSALEGLNTINTRTLNMASGFKS